MIRRRRVDLALAVVAALIALLPNPAAALPRLAYWFRDFTVTFYPLRALAARELAEGRVAWWNPYVNEGAFMLPVLYPADLLHALFPGPAVASWLLTLHLPLAAVAAYALARDLGTPPAGALVSGVLYAAGGLAVSSLNLYVFLQALALAPVVVLTLRRAAVFGGRWTAGAALAIAASLLTLAVEFVAQAIALGALTAWADRAPARGAARASAAAAIGLALAAVPLMTVSAILPETVRGAGFAAHVVLGNELHPAGLLQAIVPRLFGDPAAPVEAWWGQRFFTKGFPYFLTLYVGALAPALAAVGAPAVASRRRVAWLAASAVALWYALGERGGLAPVVLALPGADFFRFPIKALLLPYLALAVLSGAGTARLFAGRGWRAFGMVSAASGLLGIALALGPRTAAEAVVAGASPTVHLDVVSAVLASDGRWLAALSAAGVALSAGVVAGRVRANVAAGVAIALFAGDLVLAARGVNPQATPAFFAPLPEMKALGLDGVGGRVFTYGLDESPAFRRFLAARAAGRGLWSFFLSRQALAPYANVIDSVSIAEGKDLTGFILHPAALAPGALDPSRVGGILPRLREAAVAAVVSLDPLRHPDLLEAARVPAGPPGIELHVYRLRDPWPRVSVECGAGCAGSAAHRARPGLVEIEVDAPAAGTVLVRDNYARGWTAEVDGAPVAVSAAGRYIRVPVGSGQHRITLSYRPPRLREALLVTVLGIAALAACLARSPR